MGNILENELITDVNERNIHSMPLCFALTEGEKEEQLSQFNSDTETKLK